MVLAGVIASGQAFGQETLIEPLPTAQEKLIQREALRRAAVLDQQKRKDEFARNCIKPELSDRQLEACPDAITPARTKATDPTTIDVFTALP